MSLTDRRRLFDLGALRRLARPDVQTVARGDAALTFLGFSHKRVERVLGRFDVRAGAPPILELQDVLFFPDRRCLYLADGARVDESMVIYVEPDAPARLNDKFDAIQEATMAARTTPPPNLARIAGPVLFVGEAHDHYGHMITDTLGRLWALDEVDPELTVLFTPDPKLRLDPPHVRFLLAAAGLDERRILRPKTPVLFERLLCPIAGLQVSRVYEAFQRPHRRIGLAALGGSASGPERPVYLSRRGLHAGHRRILGEEALEQTLEREGYLIVEPERLALPDQIALFNGQAPVVGAFGSALHTVMFRTRPEAQKLATLLPEAFPLPPRLMMIDAVKGCQAAYVRCLTEAPRQEGHPEGGHYRLDVAAAMERLDAAGFLGRRRA